VRLHDALGLAGGAGGVEQRGGVVRRAFFDLLVDEARLHRKQPLAEPDQFLVRQQAGVAVVAQSARIVIVDVLQPGVPFAHLEHLVDLLLVLDDRVGDLRVFEHVDHLGGDRVLVHRHRNAAQALRRHHREVQPRAVLADDRQVLAAPEALHVQSRGELPDLVGRLRPGPGLPDAQVLLTQRGTAGAQPRVLQQQLRKGVRLC
jgi:hypothetical protein